MKLTKLFAAIALATTIVSCNHSTHTVSELKTEVDSLNYAIGVITSQQIKNSFKDISINRSLIDQGMQNGIDSANLLISIKEATPFIRKYFQKKSKQDLEKKYAEWKKENEQYLAENKNKPEVKTTASGLQYMIIKEGKGATPKITDRVKVHYKGTNIKGEEFDSSYKRNTPQEFGVTQVIKGWTEGLQLMKPGAKYKFFIPQELAYGAQQRGAKIKPFSALTFEVEMLEVLPPKK